MSTLAQYMLKRYEEPYPLPPPKETQEMIILIGYPGSGKSTTAKKQYPEATWVNQDELKTIKKCLKLCRAALEAGESVIIDRTNPKVTDRAPFIELAQEYDVPVTALVSGVTFEEARLLNAFRSEKTKSVPVPIIAYHKFRKWYVSPDFSEEFTAIETIRPCLGDMSEEEKDLFLSIPDPNIKKKKEAKQAKQAQ